MMEVRVNLDGFNFTVTGHYQPTEPASYAIRRFSLGQPGSPAEFEIHDATTNEEYTITADTLDELERGALAQIEQEGNQ